MSALLIPAGNVSDLSTGTWGAKSWSNAGGLHSLAFETQVVRYSSEYIIYMIYIYIGTKENKLTGMNLFATSLVTGV